MPTHRIILSITLLVSCTQTCCISLHPFNFFQPSAQPSAIDIKKNTQNNKTHLMAWLGNILRVTTKDQEIETMRRQLQQNCEVYETSLTKEEMAEAHSGLVDEMKNSRSIDLMVSCASKDALTTHKIGCILLTKKLLDIEAPDETSKTQMREALRLCNKFELDRKRNAFDPPKTQYLEDEQLVRFKPPKRHQ